jgi:hypothetical protein
MGPGSECARGPRDGPGGTPDLDGQPLSKHLGEEVRGVPIHVTGEPPQRSGVNRSYPSKVLGRATLYARPPNLYPESTQLGGEGAGGSQLRDVDVSSAHGVAVNGQSRR